MKVLCDHSTDLGHLCESVVQLIWDFCGLENSDNTIVSELRLVV